MPAAAIEASELFTPATQAELSRLLTDNASGQRLPVYPLGGRTGLHFGNAAPRPGMGVSTAKLNRVVDFPARDLTITVEAGIRIDELKKLLAKEGLRFPVAVAQSHRATLGGVLATNVSSPLRFHHGSIRDYVIGLTAVDGLGRMFHSGGRVAKNVAGYDLCKLMVGSLGTLAIVTQVTLRLKPIPETTRFLWLAFDTFEELDRVLENLTTSAALPAAMEVFNEKAARQLTKEARSDLPAAGPVLCILVEGTAKETDWMIQTLKDETAAPGRTDAIEVSKEDGQELWQAMVNYRTSSDDPLTFQANLPPSQTIPFVAKATSKRIAIQSHAGNGIVIGHLSDETLSLPEVISILDELREQAVDNRGNLTVLNCLPEWGPQISAFGAAQPAWKWMHEIKRAFDPHDLLNPGRYLFPAEITDGQATISR